MHWESENPRSGWSFTRLVLTIGLIFAVGFAIGAAILATCHVK